MSESFRSMREDLVRLEGLLQELYEDGLSGSAGGRWDSNPTADAALHTGKMAQRSDVEHLLSEVRITAGRITNHVHRAERIGGARGGMTPKSHSVTEDEGHAAADRADRMHRRWERRLYPDRRPYPNRFAG